MPPLLKRLDQVIRGIRDTGATGEIRYGEGPHPRQGRDRVLPPERVDGCEPARPGRRRRPRADRRRAGSCGAATIPHDEGTWPYTREHLRSRFHDVPEKELREILAGNAARLYDFDLDALAPLAAEFGPTVDEIARADRRGAGEGTCNDCPTTWIPRRSSERPGPGRRAGAARPPAHAQPAREAQRAEPSVARRAHRALRAADVDDDVRVTIVRGAGSCFSAGYDLGGGNEGHD